jgi:hypothetical protein
VSSVHDRPDRNEERALHHVAQQVLWVDNAGTGLSLELLGQRCRATVRSEPMFDPEHRRPRIDAGQ